MAALNEIDIPKNRSGYRWVGLMFSILGVTDADVSSMTKTVAGFKSMIAGKANPGGGFDRFQNQAQNVLQSLGDNLILTSANLSGLTTKAGVIAIFTANDSSLVGLPYNSFATPVGIAGGPGSV